MDGHADGATTATLTVAASEGGAQVTVLAVAADRPIKRSETLRRDGHKTLLDVTRSFGLEQEDRRCDWAPDLLLLDTDTAPGATWANDSSCDVGRGSKTEHDRATESVEVRGTDSVTVNGSVLNGTVVHVDRKTTASGADQWTETDSVDEVIDPRGLVLKWSERVQMAVPGYPASLLPRWRDFVLTGLPS